jgi:hypothetical protein
MRLSEFSSSRLVVWSIACSIASVLIALSGFGYGVHHRFQHWMTEAIEYQNVKLGAAITEHVYGLSLGRTSHQQVWRALQEGGFTIHKEFLDRLGTKFPDNLSNANILNNGLKRAATLEKLREPRELVKDIKPVEPDDLGMADYYQLAFKLFGLKIQSFFKLYYLIYFISLFVFLACYWRRLEATAALLLVVGGHFFILAFLVGGVPKESLFGVATPYNQRFVSVLGVISALHLALMLLWPPRRSAMNVAALVLQTAILFFVFTLRRSALWELLWVVALPIAYLGIGALWKLAASRRWLVSGPPPEAMRQGLTWAAVGFVGCAYVFSLINDSRNNAVYRFSDEFLTEHMVWTSTYLGLSMHPDWTQRFGKYLIGPNGIATGDEIPFVAADKWLRENYGLEVKYIISDVWGVRYRTLERIMKEALVDFVRRNRRYTLELQLYYKPRIYFSHFIRWNRSLIDTWPWWGLLAFASTVGLFGYACVLLGRANLAALYQITALLICGAALAALPAMLIFPSHSTMGDQVLMLNVALIAAAGTIVARVARRRALGSGA